MKKQMTFRSFTSWGLILLAVGFLSNSRLDAAQIATCRKGPLIKNLVSPTTPACASEVTASPAFTQEELRTRSLPANSPQDRLNLASHYRAKADALDAKGAEYESIATALRDNPAPKNLVAPGTAARYDYAAKEFHREAKMDRELASSQEQLAQNTAAGIR